MNERESQRKKHVLFARSESGERKASLWVHRIKRKAALSWQSFRRQETLGLVGASGAANESKPKTDQGSLPAADRRRAEGWNAKCYRGSKRGQAVTIERLSLSIPSHTGKRSNGKARPCPFGSWSIAHIQTSDWERGNAHEAPAREGLPGRMPMGADFPKSAG
ncbi:hypothetical protein HAX54_007685 [Datura stramonium]|uniref:Uncharacterized protein n=1 Tax=Datura stramonium TaxID=4076 RepID=A0ABS8WUS1_DATST|nr:hypothetical protein [Datura stramonium]